MAITGGYVSVEGVKTYYETNNGPRNPKGTLVCLHTAGRETRQYHGMMDCLENDYAVIAFDMPAHGKSWPLPGNVGIKTCDGYSRFTWDFIQALGIRDPVVVGCSLAGNIVYHIAANYPVKAAVVCQGSPYIKAMRTSYGAAVNLLDNPYVSPQHSHWDFTDSLIGSKCPQDIRDFIMWGVCQECGRAKQADLAIYNDFDVREQLRNIRCPTLLIRGEDDWNVPEHYYDTALQYLTNAKKLDFVKVPGFGHFIVVEAPQIVCKLIDGFLTEEGT